MFLTIHIEKHCLLLIYLDDKLHTVTGISTNLWSLIISLQNTKKHSDLSGILGAILNPENSNIFNGEFLRICNIGRSEKISCKTTTCTLESILKIINTL